VLLLTREDRKALEEGGVHALGALWHSMTHTHRFCVVVRIEGVVSSVCSMQAHKRWMKYKATHAS
jgi:hypothetical protein